MILLTQNSELREDRVWNWALPAWVVKRNGKGFNVCPSAGACVQVCYARNGTYLFPQVKAAHMRNLDLVIDQLSKWKTIMIGELGSDQFRPTYTPRFPDLELEPDAWAADWMRRGGTAVRIHDSGDFFSDEYLQAWLDIAELFPDVLFYTYTKEVPRFRRMVEGKAPTNFRWLFSMGGKHDHTLDKNIDRHAEVFPTLEAVVEAGYLDQTASDLLAVLLPTTKVGIPANNIPHFKKKMGSQTFGEMQIARQAHKKDTADT